MKSKIPLVVATVLGLLALLGLHRYIQAVEKGLKQDLNDVEVAVAAIDIESGTKLERGMISFITVPERYVVAESIRKNEIEAYYSRNVLSDVKGGQTLLILHFGGSQEDIERKVREGYRAIAIRVDEGGGLAQGMAGMLRPGHRVDVLVTFQIEFHQGPLAGERTWKTFTLMENKSILAVDTVGSAVAATQPFAFGREAERYSTVTLELTPEEAQEIALAQTKGRIHLTLRNPDDSRQARPAASDIQKIIERCGGDGKYGIPRK